MPPDHSIDRASLIDAYFAHAAALEQGNEEDAYFWAVEAIWELIERDPEATWTLLLEMISRAEGDRRLATIAAGPLQDFIVAHGTRFLSHIEAQARSNAKFRRALVGVWGDNEMSPEVLDKIRALIEGEPPL